MPARRATKRTKNIRKAMGAVLGYNLRTEKECAVIDVLADLRHLCDEKGWDFADLDRQAHQHYLEEKLPYN